MTPEQEWRALILNNLHKIEKKVDHINTEMMTLKIKVALFSSVVGSIASFIASKLF